MIWLPIFGFGALVVAGFVVFIRRGDWILASIPLLSIALVCLTPWPEEFKRYLTPIAPFLTIAAILALERLDAALRARGSRGQSCWDALASTGLLVLLLGVQTFARYGSSVIAIATVPAFVLDGGATGPRFFYHGRCLVGLGAGCRLDRRARAHPALSSPQFSAPIVSANRPSCSIPAYGG